MWVRPKNPRHPFYRVALGALDVHLDEVNSRGGPEKIVQCDRSDFDRDVAVTALANRREPAFYKGQLAKAFEAPDSTLPEPTA